MAIQKESLNQSLLALFYNNEFIEKLKDKFNIANGISAEECYDIAKAYLSDISFEKFQEDLLPINAYFQENSEGGLDLTELDEVAGGVPGGAVIVSGSVIIAAVLITAT
ncbi:hypothetical protein FACS1894127_1800 [Clostridia bacterium]|nr:hypothetical protein FACS1894127_1800 [Clostridia bacterium]